MNYKFNGKISHDAEIMRFLTKYSIPLTNILGNKRLATVIYCLLLFFVPNYKFGGCSLSGKTFAAQRAT